MTTRVLVTSLAGALFLVGCADTGVTMPTSVRIGALLPLTGTLSSYGASCQAGLLQAEGDINAYFEDIAASIRVEVVVEDTASDPTTAFAKLGQLSTDGIDVVVGPLGSDELAAVIPLAERLNMFLVGPGGGDPSLAVAGDGVLRLVPDDTLQAEALAALLRSRGIAALAVLARQGAWGDELEALLADRFTERGGVVVAQVRYDPAPASGLDVRAALDELSSAVAQARADFGTNAVAVALLSYDEGVQIFKQAATDAALGEVPWFGADGFVLHAGLLRDGQDAAWAAQVRYTAAMYGGREVDPARQAAVRDPVEASLGRPADVFALTTYDALWLAALALSQSGDAPSRALLESAATSTAAVYNGASGRTLLNDAGDRTGGSYEFWMVADGDTAPTWQRAATFADGEITEIAAGTAGDDPQEGA